MALTYTWKVTTLKKMDTPQQSDVVVQAYWTKTGTDIQDGLFASFNGVTSFTLNSNEPFIPFEELTEAIVLGWIQAATINEEDAMNSIIQQQINDQRSIVTRMPWDPIPVAAPIPVPPAQ